jgi:hypothetical protein
MTTPTDLREQAAAASAELRERYRISDKAYSLACLESAATLIDQLASALPVWRPISEAPKDGTMLLLLLATGVIASGNKPDGYAWGRWRFRDGLERDQWSGGAYLLDGEPTRWMPLPQSEPVPEEKEKA